MDGSMILLATVGDPVAQVQTPERMPLHVRAEHLSVVAAMLRGVANLRGCSVTVPQRRR